MIAANVSPSSVWAFLRIGMAKESARRFLLRLPPPAVHDPYRRITINDLRNRADPRKEKKGRKGV